MEDLYLRPYQINGIIAGCVPWLIIGMGGILADDMRTLVRHYRTILPMYLAESQAPCA